MVELAHTLLLAPEQVYSSLEVLERMRIRKNAASRKKTKYIIPFFPEVGHHISRGAIGSAFDC